jgi:adenylate kinase
LIPGARFIILGKQGAGKGTQCARLKLHYVVPHISTGDMFRAALKAGTEMGKVLGSYMETGELVPDEVTIGIVQERLDSHDALHRGFILDGFPRNAAQAEKLSKLLAPGDIDLAVDLELPTEIALERLASRRVCRGCGTNYSTSRPPTVGWTCDVCEGEVIQRDDDNEEAIKRRLVLYEQETEPLIAYYLERDKLVTVDALGTEDEVFARLVRAIDRRREK